MPLFATRTVHPPFSIRCAVFSALCALFAILPLRADFFWRLPRSSDTTLTQLGGARVYATDVQVNGSPGTLAAYAFEIAPATLRARLARTLGLPASGTARATLLTHVQRNRLQRLLILPSPDSSDASLVFVFDQSLRDAAESKRGSPAWPADLPVLAAEPLFTAACAQTRTAFVTAESDASPEDAVQAAAHTLLDAGWASPAPTTATFRLFVSGRKQCVLFASRESQSEKTTISLLQREGATP